ncbi:MAG: thioesterase domain-containing protein [Vicinamibacterales bacterium]|nr:thioesterase domain-containing protein [Vicinamibacterales bacterium]
MSRLPPSRWLRTLDAVPGTALRLICFPYAGGGASAFRGWGERLCAGVELVAVQLPGREDRLAEVPFTRLDTLISALSDELGPALDRPFAFFGHSMGALTAFSARCGLAALIMFIATALASATTQQRPPDDDTSSAEPSIVTIRGCVDGTLLTATDLLDADGSGTGASMGERFRVVGDEELLEELRAFSGHEVDLIGVLLDEPGRRPRGGSGGRVGSSGRIGKAGPRVWIGAGGRTPSRLNPFPEPGEIAAVEPVELEMRAVIPVNGTCPIL